MQGKTGKAPARDHAAGANFFIQPGRSGELRCLNDLAGLDAAGAHADALAGSLDDGFDRLQVHIPATAGRVVSVRDVIAELRALAAKITFLCHDLLQSLSRKFFREQGVHLPGQGSNLS
jgi:hypothetical protein